MQRAKRITLFIIHVYLFTRRCFSLSDLRAFTDINKKQSGATTTTTKNAIGRDINYTDI